MKLIRIFGIAMAMGILLLVVQAFGQWSASKQTTLYVAESVITMDPEQPRVEAVAVKAGEIIGLGALAELQTKFPKARLNQRFSGQYLYPGFIDPHIHMLLAAVQYALPMIPPWDMPMGAITVAGVQGSEAFLQRVAELEATDSRLVPLIIYGYHDLIHGEIDRWQLDKVESERPLIIWHYSSHDFYLNTAAIEWLELAAEQAQTVHGIALDNQGRLTGRVYEDAAKALLPKLARYLMNPMAVRHGYRSFAAQLARGGVTTVADLGYGIFGKRIEDLNIVANWWSAAHSGFRLYLVPEHRAFLKAHGDQRIERIKRLVSGDDWAAAPVLPQVKFFADGAFYSQTMRVSKPGYLAGQSQGSQGVWVTAPEQLAATMKPYWEAGLGARIHSNGDAAQEAVLDAIEQLSTAGGERRVAVEHAGLFSPASVARAADLNVAISAASHYVFYLGQALQEPLQAPRADWLLPLASHLAAGNRVALHSDAPLAPPLPLLAASVHVERTTREGAVLNPEQRLTPLQALKTITIDAAYMLGLEDSIGSLVVGKQADFTVLAADPLNLPASQWADIGIVARVVAGHHYDNPSQDTGSVSGAATEVGRASADIKSH